MPHPIQLPVKFPADYYSTLYMLRSRLVQGLQKAGSAHAFGRVAPRILTPIRFYGHGPPPLTREFAQERILGVLSNCDKVDQSKLTPDASFADLGLDSLDIVDALFYIEEEFTIVMPE